MNKSGIGIGSASLVLIFTVLCLAVFSLISYTSARNNMTLAEVEAELVKGYYEADARAEIIISELLAEVTDGERIEEFTSAISDGKELYVKVNIRNDFYDILIWQIRNTEEWVPDKNLPVWLGN